MRRAVAAVVALLVAGCAAGPDLPAVPAYDAEGLARLRYQAVIVGGDASINAFDNAAERMAKDLLKANAIAPAGMHRYSARPRRPPAILLASVGNVLDGIAALKPVAGQGCLVFATAHGAQEKGLYFPANGADPILDPERLDRALVAGCGIAPTVVVLSGCYSGHYLRPPMTRANRIILTAARADRPSFGCGAGNVFTEFDDCLLNAIEAAAAPLTESFAAAKQCVSARERQQNVAPSEPQSWVGPAVASLRLPWRAP